MRPEAGSQLARVVSVGRNAAWIAFENDDVLRLAALRKSLDRTSIVAGDLVRATPLDDERVVIDAREPRSFALTRTTANGRVKTMAANVDGIAVVAAFVRPPLYLAMIDELIAFAEIHDLAARLIFTKADLADGDDDLERIPGLYRSLGYVVLVCRPKFGAGIDAVAAELASHRTLLIGQSGVGKSSLFAALGGSASVGEVSKEGRGKQTTTTGRLHRFPQGFLIDSPGFGEFELTGVTPGELALGFREFSPHLGTCRFADCIHRSEPGCSIRAAVDAGSIAASRYGSYATILGRIQPA